MKKIFLNSIKYLAALIISFICFEFFLSWTKISVPSVVVNDSKLGYKFKPKAEIFSLEEGFCMGTINELGYIGPAYSYKKESDVYRIALIGDSYVEGFQLFERHHFGRILENELQKITNKKIEILNFGVAGADFRKMYLIDEQLVSQFNTDLNLFFISTGSLINKDENLGPDFKVVNDSLVIDYSFASSNEFKIKEKLDFTRNFAFYSLIQKAYARYKSGKALDILFDKFNFFKKTKKNKPESKKNNPRDKFYEVNRILFNKLNAKETISHHSVFIIRSKLPDHYSFIKDKFLTYNLYTLTDSLKSIGKDPFYWKPTRVSGHWNHFGHKIIGKTLASFLSKYITSSNFIAKH